MPDSLVCSPLPRTGEGLGEGALHRFFVEPALLGGDRVVLTGQQAHQMSRVLRLKVGDRVVLVDGAGQEYVVRLDEVRSSMVAGAVESRRQSRQVRVAIDLK